VRELAINSPEVLQLRKEEIEGGDSIGDVFGRRRCRRLEEGGGPDLWTHGISDRLADAGARTLGLRRLGPERAGETGRVDLGSGKPSRPKGGREGSGRLGQWAKSQGKESKMFSFSFSNFSKEFHIDFVFLFCIFKKWTQYKILCSSMNAQSYFYPYI
jgi:hypothetical protein